MNYLFKYAELKLFFNIVPIKSDLKRLREKYSMTSIYNVLYDYVRIFPNLNFHEKFNEKFLSIEDSNIFVLCNVTMVLKICHLLIEV